MEPLAADTDDAVGHRGYGSCNDNPAITPHHDVNNHDAEQEWSSSDSPDTSETTTTQELDVVGHKEQAIPRPTDLAINRDTTDFSIHSRHANKISARRQRNQNLTIKIPTTAQSPTLASPDSDGDILGFLDFTPDPLPNCDDCTGTHTYSKVYHIKQYTELMPDVFIPEQPIQLRITNVRLAHSSLNIFSNHMLLMSLEHGDFKWEVHQKVKSVAALHSTLFILRTKLKMPAATKDARQRKQSMRVHMKAADKQDTVDCGNGVQTRRVLKYPRRALQTMDNSVQSDLEVYLKNLLHHSLFRSHRAVLEFFEISPVSFISELGQKIKEGYVKKRTGGHSNGCCRWCFSPCTGKFNNRWLVLKETCLFFLAPETGEVRGVMLMDNGFQVSHGYRPTGLRNGLLISNLSRSVIIKCDSELSKKEWYSHITKTQRKYGTDFTTNDRRFNSFAPVRCNSYAQWYVDSAKYMWDVADILESAKEEIFITDWWMSPEIYLKRPDLTGSRWRLGEVLKRQAERGVRIFILLYKEVELALGISSLLTKQTIRGLHPNIKILRHPDHYAGGVLYWAHHEKIVVVDQMYAFISGIDLAFGRWDDYRHKLVDVGHAGLQNQVTPSRPTALGSALQHLVRGTNEVLVNTVTSAPSSRKTSLDVSPMLDMTQSTTASSLFLSPSESSPCIPRSKIMDGEKGFQENDINVGRDGLGIMGKETSTPVNGSLDKCNNIPPKSGIRISITEDQENIPLKGKSKSMKRDNKVKIGDTFIISSDEESPDGGRVGKGLKEVKRIGLDIVEEVKEKGRGMKNWTSSKLPALQRRNSTGKDLSDTSSSSEDEVGGLKRKSFYKRSRQKLKLRKRMDSTSSLAQTHSALTVEDTTSVHLWVGKDYVNWISKDLTNLDKPFQDIVDRHQTPRMPWHDIGLFVEGPAARDAARHFIERWNAIKTEKAKPDSKYPYLLPRTYDANTFLPSTLQQKHKVNAQVVRSVGKWSAGIEDDESSIFNAYINLIRNAKHYIYIENQFFITSSNNSESQDVTNFIGHEIVERIVQAHSNNEVFRVYILLPLLPAFEGMIGKSSGIAMQFIVYWNYVSISRGKSSLIHCLKERGVDDWEKYLSFCSTRTHQVLEGRAVSELVYIHSKLMIVDDRFVIAGSANINDRSMKGNRDSEVCLVVEDQEFEEGVMNGKRYEAGIYAGGMRRFLFSEHLGITEVESPVIDVWDPISDAFFLNTWKTIAIKNTQIFEEVFSCYPCDSATTFEEVEKLRNSPSMADINPAEALIKVKDIQGHLVCFPLDFLKDEELKPGIGSKEFMVPMEIWT